MKRILIFLLVLFLKLNLYSTAFDHIISGEYAFYKDNRGDMDFIRGYCIFLVEDGSAFIIIRNIDKKTNESLNLIVQMDTDDEGLPSIKKINGLSKDTKPEFTQSYIDILNYITLYNNHKDEIKYNTKIKDPWENYDLFFIFNKILPVFRFKEIFMNNEKVSKYYFIKGGILNFKEYKDFFNMEPEFDTNDFNKLYYPVIQKRKKTQKEINGVKINLDDRWKSNTALGFPGFWLEVKTKRDSQIMIEKGEWKKFQDMGINSIEEFIIKSIFNQNILPDSIHFEKKNNEYSLECLIIDQNKNLNIIKYKFIFKDEFLIIINFSSFYHIYEKNKSYYDKILNSVEY